MFFILSRFPFLDCDVCVGFLWKILMIPVETQNISLNLNESVLVAFLLPISVWLLRKD